MKLFGIKLEDDTAKLLFVCIAALLVIMALWYTSSKKKSCSRDMMDTYPGSDSPAGVSPVGASPVGASGSGGASGGAPTGYPAPSSGEFDSHFTSLSETPSSMTEQKPTNPADLLPSDKNTAFSKLNPTDTAPTLLDAGFHNGIDTVSSSLRNANLQLRSEPANPTTSQGPWNQSTITPDTTRRALEIGSGSP
jgi:hypothetical protein